MAETLYETGSYKVVLHEKPGARTVIVGFQPRDTQDRKLKAGVFPKPFMPAAITESEIPASFVSFLVNHNTWYLDEEAMAGARAIRARMPDHRLVTYGSSMGGYAAINLSEVLQADLILALSPQSTPLPPYADLIGDKRYVKDRGFVTPALDIIGTGRLMDKRGLLFFDPAHALDAPHAARIAGLTAMTLVGVPRSGHPCGRELNRLYPLRTLLEEVVADRLQVDALRRSLLTAPPRAELDNPFLAPFFPEGWSDLSAIRPGYLQQVAQQMLANPEALGPDNPTRIGSVQTLLSIALHAEMDWHGEKGRREVTILALCRALARQGQRPRAEEIARAELPPDYLARFVKP